MNKYSKGWREIGEQEADKNIIREEAANPSEGSPYHHKFVKKNNFQPDITNFPF